MLSQAVVIISEDPVAQCGLAELVRAEGLGDPLVFDLPRTYVAQYDPAACGCILLDLRVSAYEAVWLLKQQQKVQCRMALVYFTVSDSVPVAVEGASCGFELTTYSGPEPRGYLMKKVREALRQQESTCVEAARKALLKALYENTSPRERQVLERLARGCTTKQIAAELVLSPRTVEIYRSRLHLKLQATSNAELVRLWATISADQARQARQRAGAA